MGVDFAIELEPDAGDPQQLSEDDIAAYYRTHCPPGTPPLAEIREQVARALALSRRDERADPIVGLHQEFVDRFGRDRIWWDHELEAAAVRLGVTPLRSFQVGAPQWCDAAEALRTVRALQKFLHADHPQRSRERECLDLLERLFTFAEKRRRRWRLLALW